ncbi:MAG: alkaline phosphatase [Thermoanaerobaculia bacterium]
MIRFLVPLAALLTIGCASAPSPARAETISTRPKSVILIVGDGVGVAHVTAAKLLRGSEFQVGRMPVAGLMTTHSASSLVTDSAAAATAMATGVKAVNRTVGVDANGTPVRNVVEAAEAAGRATGTVTTGAFWDATPASFVAHHKSRYDVLPIVQAFLGSGIDLIAGGGAEWFGVEGRPELAGVVASSNVTLVTTRDALVTAKGDRVLAVFPMAKNEMDAAEAPLPVLASWAIERLSRDPDGFFLLLEHEGTDGTGHNNLTDEFKKAMVSLDETVGVALEFARTRGNVLVIVTGDHETGGLTLDVKNEQLVFVWSNKGHTAAFVPVFAFGPGSERFEGLIDNTDLGKALLELVGTTE